MRSRPKAAGDQQAPPHPASQDDRSAPLLQVSFKFADGASFLPPVSREVDSSMLLNDTDFGESYEEALSASQPLCFDSQPVLAHRQDQHSQPPQLQRRHSEHVACKPPPLAFNDIAFETYFAQHQHVNDILSSVSSAETQPDLFAQSFAPHFLNNDFSASNIDPFVLSGDNSEMLWDTAGQPNFAHNLFTAAASGTATTRPQDLIPKRRHSAPKPSRKRVKFMAGIEQPEDPAGEYRGFIPCLLTPSATPNVATPSSRRNFTHVEIVTSGVDDSSMLYAEGVSPRKYNIKQVRGWLALQNDQLNSEDLSLSTLAMAKYLRLASRAETLIDSTISFYTPRIAQKSYGTEKRFFCPSPMVTFAGAEWFEPSLESPGILAVKPRLSTVSYEPTGLQNVENCGGLPSLNQMSSQQDPSGVTVFKTMFIGDLTKARNREFSCDDIVDLRLRALFGVIGSDRTKRDFEFYLRIQDTPPPPDPLDFDDLPSDDTLHVGTFMSDVITLISKPSKKRAPASKRRKQDLRAAVIGSESIPHGTTVSLYNRLKSQTVSTKCLCLEPAFNGELVPIGRNSIWQPFQIKFVNYTDQECILYNELVYFECPVTGWKSEHLIVVSVDPKTQRPVPVDENEEEEQVLQLQKVAFRRVSNWNEYFALSSDSNVATFINISSVHPSPEASDRSSAAEQHDSVIPENALWTLVGVSYMSYSWFDPHRDGSMNFDVPRLPVTPVPKVLACNLLDPRIVSPAASSSENLSTTNYDFHLMDLDLSMHAHAVLETLDKVKKSINGWSGLSVLVSMLHFNVYLGNVQCDVVHYNSAFVSSAGEIFPVTLLDEFPANPETGEEEAVLSAYHLQLLCKLPSFSSCVTRGKWFRNLHFLQNYQNASMTPVVTSSNSAPQQSRPDLNGDEWILQENEIYPRDRDETELPGLDTGFPLGLGSYEIVTVTPNSTSSPASGVCGSGTHEHDLSGWSSSQANIRVPIILVRKADAMVYRTRWNVLFRVSL